jgi:hypothetical protein
MVLARIDPEAPFGFLGFFGPTFQNPVPNSGLEGSGLYGV